MLKYLILFSSAVVGQAVNYHDNLVQYCETFKNYNSNPEPVLPHGRTTPLAASMESAAP